MWLASLFVRRYRCKRLILSKGRLVSGPECSTGRFLAKRPVFFRNGVIGHFVLLEGRFFGFVARESRFFSWSCLPRSCEYCIVPCVWPPHDPSR